MSPPSIGFKIIDSNQNGRLDLTDQVSFTNPDSSGATDHRGSSGRSVLGDPRTTVRDLLNPICSFRGNFISYLDRVESLLAQVSTERFSPEVWNYITTLEVGVASFADPTPTAACAVSALTPEQYNRMIQIYIPDQCPDLRITGANVVDRDADGIMGVNDRLSVQWNSDVVALGDLAELEMSAEEFFSARRSFHVSPEARLELLCAVLPNLRISPELRDLIAAAQRAWEGA